MLPVTIGLGVINFDLSSTRSLGTLVSDAGAARDRRRVPHLHAPQGMFSVAVATVLFPTLSRFAARQRPATACARRSATGMRQIYLLLIPAAAFMLVLATPIVRLVYQRGDVRRRLDRARRRRRCSGSRSACRSRRQPAADAHVLQPPAAVDPDARSRSRNLVVNVVVSARALQAVRDRRASCSARSSANAGDDGRCRRCCLRRELHGGLEGRAHAARDRADARRRRRCSGVVAYGVWCGARPACSGARCSRRSSRVGAALAAGVARLRRAVVLRCASPRRARSRSPCVAGGSRRRRRPSLSGRPWPTRTTSATSRSSPTSTTASRRWPTASSS